MRQAAWQRGAPARQRAVGLLFLAVPVLTCLLAAGSPLRGGNFSQSSFRALFATWGVLLAALLYLRISMLMEWAPFSADMERLALSLATLCLLLCICTPLGQSAAGDALHSALARIAPSAYALCVFSFVFRLCLWQRQVFLPVAAMFCGAALGALMLIAQRGAGNTLVELYGVLAAQLLLLRLQSALCLAQPGLRYSWIALSMYK